jgi:TRAP-type mannitol/chloroaromatic compound transport system permease small subunit
MLLIDIFGKTFRLCNDCYHVIVQVLDVIVQSYFEGNMFNNKIWTGTVEGYKQLSVVYRSIKI